MTTVILLRWCQNKVYSRLHRSAFVRTARHQVLRRVDALGGVCIIAAPADLARRVDKIFLARRALLILYQRFQVQCLGKSDCPGIFTREG